VTGLLVYNGLFVTITSEHFESGSVVSGVLSMVNKLRLVRITGGMYVLGKSKQSVSYCQLSLLMFLRQHRATQHATFTNRQLGGRISESRLDSFTTIDYDCANGTIDGRSHR